MASFVLCQQTQQQAMARQPSCAASGAPRGGFTGTFGFEYRDELRHTASMHAPNMLDGCRFHTDRSMVARLAARVNVGRAMGVRLGPPPGVPRARLRARWSGVAIRFQPLRLA